MKREKMPKLDVTKYVGDKGNIIDARYVNTKHGEAIKVTGEVVQLKDGDTLPEGKTLEPSRIFGLSKNEMGEIVIAEDGILDKFLSEKGIKTDDMPEFELNKEIEVLLGKPYVIQKNDKGYLTIA